MGIEIKLDYDDSKEIKELFLEYTKMLIEKEPSMEEYLKLQSYDSEIEHLNDKYGLPYGRLYIAKFDNEIVGCIALRKIDDKNCEMKRLFVKPEFRGNNIANELINTIIDDTKVIGYKYMLLDILPFLKSAIHLYKKVGFYEIDSYNNSLVKSSIFMKLDLNKY